jgi:hypothetical protein
VLDYLYLLKHPLPRPWRIRHEVLQRLPVAILHTIRNPGKVPLACHRHLPLQIPQCMFGGVSRFCPKSPPKTLPVLSQFRPKILDLFNRYSPAPGIKQFFHHVHTLGFTTTWVNVTLSN